MMPNMDGMSFLAHLRKDPRYLTLPVAVLTAKELTREERRILEAHTTAVVAKGSAIQEEVRRLLQSVVHPAPTVSAGAG